MRCIEVLNVIKGRRDGARDECCAKQAGAWQHTPFCVVPMPAHEASEIQCKKPWPPNQQLCMEKWLFSPQVWPRSRTRLTVYEGGLTSMLFGGVVGCESGWSGKGAIQP
eukprot:1016906-Pelagomonas_calceolata.AAC.4